MATSQKAVPERIRNFAIGLIVILLTLAYIGLRSWREASPRFARQIVESNVKLQMLWAKNATLVFQSADEISNTIYAYTATADLMALDGLTGTVLWRRRLPRDEWGVRAMLTSGYGIFTITATEAHAYQASTGDWIWSTKLGDGHVAEYFQKEDALLRVYYGDRIIELSPTTGQILKDQPSGNIEWIVRNVEICHSAPEYGTNMIGIDRTTGGVLWSSVGPMFLKIERFPIQSVDDVLFVLTSDSGMCSLDLIRGRYAWCRPEEYISNMSLSHDEKTGYIINSDFSLVKIALATGEVLGRIQFSPNMLPLALQSRGFEYSVATTQDVVVVSFGDSNQTFGLKELK